MGQLSFNAALSFIKSSGADVQVGIIGSRTYPYPWLVREFVSELPKNVVVVSGAGGVVDTSATFMAKRMGLRFQEFPADWRHYGRAAGNVRSKELVKSGLCCLVAFLHGPSVGSNRTIEYALKEGIPVFIFR